MKYDWDREKVQKAVQNSSSYRDTLRKLNIPVSGNNGQTLKKKIEEYGIDTTHFTFHATSLRTRKNVQEYLIKGSFITTSKLKAKLIEAGIKENRCELCGADSWLGKRLICQLHHINGDNTDNRLENLQILCPNCHSQTDNYCGQANVTEKKKYYCADCGRELKSNRSTYCLSCAGKRRQKIDITKEELLEVLRQTGNRLQAAAKIGVSETCIRKWCKRFDLPSKSSELKKLL